METFVLKKMASQHSADLRQIMVLSDGDVDYASTCFAPGKELGISTIVMHHNILVMRREDEIIMIDGGNGHAYQPGAGKLADELLKKDIRPDMITDVLLTHAHPDHINGLLDAVMAPVFSNARIHLSEADYKFWMGDAPDFSGSRNEPEQSLGIHGRIKERLKALQPQLTLLDKPFSFIKAHPSPGHTPGHTLYEIDLPELNVLHIADTVHDELLVAQPEWGSIFDVNFEQAARERRRVLSDLADSGQLAFAYHLPWPGFGRVVRKGEGFEWIPESVKLIK